MYCNAKLRRQLLLNNDDDGLTNHSSCNRERNFISCHVYFQTVTESGPKKRRNACNYRNLHRYFDSVKIHRRCKRLAKDTT